MDQMTGIFAPPGLAKGRVDILVKGFQNAMADPAFKAAASRAQLTLQPLAGEEFLRESKAVYTTIKGLEDVLKAGTSNK
jgi:tripartite-type tricarboxylate transporter receptor subunit TctC